MGLAITAAFDAGNIEVLSLDGPQAIELAIRKDTASTFYQWFYFRLTGAANQPCTLRITNCGSSAYPDGWPGYRACVSEDRQLWTRAETSYADGVLTISYTPKTDSAYFAYFAPYSMERHADLVARIGQSPRAKTSVMGHSLDGQAMDLITIGTPGPGKRPIWFIARQHPGETMAEWCMEGALEKLIDTADPVVTKLLQTCVFYCVPNMCPDGSRRGHLRTNTAGANLNREWQSPSLAQSPEVYWTLAAMDKTGVDLCLDMHGDEALPHNFIAGFDGIPSLTRAQQGGLERYKAALANLSPDFQTKVGYPIAKPGEANMTMCTNALAERFGAVAMTLEMPFKDAIDNPDAVHGWSPERSKRLGAACVDAVWAILPEVKSLKARA
jgi:murein tripeptide amidase MpaA